MLGLLKNTKFDILMYEPTNELEINNLPERDIVAKCCDSLAKFRCSNFLDDGSSIGLDCRRKLVLEKQKDLTAYDIFNSRLA